MRKKILSLALLGLLSLTGCNGGGTDSSSSSSSPVSSDMDSSNTSSDSEGDSSYVDPDGIVNVHFNSDGNVTLKASSANSNMEPTSEGYFTFTATVASGYSLVSLTAVGDRTGLTYTIAGTGPAYNIVMTDEDVTITATAAEAESTEIPDEAIEGASTMFGTNRILTYTMTDMMPSLGGGFTTTNTTSVGDSVAIRQIDGSMRGTNVFVKDPDGNISMPSLGIDNKEIYESDIFRGGSSSKAEWDSTMGLVYCSNPLDFICRAANQTGFEDVDPTMLRDNFNFSTTVEDDLTTHALTLKPGKGSSSSDLVGNFLYVFLMNDMALGSLFLDDYTSTTITDMTINLDSDYNPTSLSISFSGKSTYQSTSYDAVGTILVTNFEHVDSVADPYAARTEESASDIYTAHSDLLSKLAEGNYTISIAPVRGDGTTSSYTELGFDGMPNGLTFSDHAAESGHIYAFDNYVISDQVAPTSANHTTDASGTTTTIENPTQGTYAAVLNSADDSFEMYTLTEDDVVSDNTFLSESKLGTYESDPASAVALKASDFTPDLEAIDYHFFTKNADGSYSLSISSSDLIWGNLDADILSSVFSPLDYILGDSSALYNIYYDNFTTAFTGLTDLTVSFTDDSIQLSATYVVNDWLNSTSYTSKVNYTIDQIGTTSSSTISDAAKADLTALQAHLAA